MGLPWLGGRIMPRLQCLRRLQVPRGQAMTLWRVEAVLTVVVIFASAPVTTAISLAGGFAPQWHALLPTPVEARARGSQPPDGGWGPVGIDSGQALLRKPAGMGKRRVCVCKAEAIEETRSERFSLRAAFKVLPEAWRGVAVNAWSSLLAGAVAYTIATPIEAFKVELFNGCVRYSLRTLRRWFHGSSCTLTILFVLCAATCLCVAGLRWRMTVGFIHYVGFS